MKQQFRIVVYQGKKKIFDVKADSVNTHQERSFTHKMVEVGQPAEIIPDGHMWGHVSFKSYKTPRMG
jgi:hypothetical protein